MEALVYFVLWAAAIFLMMRLGCGVYVMGLGKLHNISEADAADRRAGAKPWHAPERAVDPVCRRRVVTASAKTSVFEGEIYFFCSRECREVFEAAAELYVDGSSSGPERPGEVHHV